MATDTTIDAAAARPVQRDRAATVTMTRNADGMPEAQADMSFWDVLDVVNPLQHIPIVNSIYRAVTGDEIAAPARVMGGILFGGVIGGAAAIANAVLEQSTGHDVGGHMMASLGFEDKPAGGTAVADAAAQGKAQGAATTTSPAATTTAAAAATAPATPQTTAANTALRPTASAVPPPTLSPAHSPPAHSPDAAARLQTAAAAGGLPLRDALASPTGEHRPSKMPARDTIPANTLQAKQAAALANQQRFAKLGETPAAAGAATAKPTATAAPPQTAPASTAPATAPATAQQTAATTATTTPATALPAAAAQAGGTTNGVPPAMLPDVMMRNLAKYEAARRAAAAKAGPGTRVDG